MTYSTFKIFDSFKAYPEATIQLSKHYVNSKQILSFSCTREVSWINNKVRDVFITAIKGYACVDVTAHACSHESAPIGSMRSLLGECSCSILDRKNENTRLNYESLVIKNILKIIGSRKEFHIKLAICQSGKLLGEQILLFRLIHELNKRNYVGTIELFLIDPFYRTLNEKAALDGEFIQAVGEQRYVQQFLEEISQCLSPNISVEGRFFESAEQYIDLVKFNSAYRHHLLIGVNLKHHPDFWNIENQIEDGKTTSLILTEDLKLPTATLPDTYNLQNFYAIDGGGSLSIKPFVGSPFNVQMIAAIAMAALLGFAYFTNPD